MNLSAPELLALLPLKEEYEVDLINLYTLVLPNAKTILFLHEKEKASLIKEEMAKIGISSYLRIEKSISLEDIAKRKEKIKECLANLSLCKGIKETKIKTIKVKKDKEDTDIEKLLKSLGI